MATLNIRNLPEEVHRRLRIRAAEHGRSMEAEARALLIEACAKGTKPRAAPEAMVKARRLQAFVDKLYGGSKPRNVVDDLIAERRREAAKEASR
jgi:plasmid stability protein